jgi:putative tryptophan/tyrosine transport system substrate-binding protein
MKRRTAVAFLPAAFLTPLALNTWAQTKILRAGILTIEDQQPWFEPFERTLAERGWVAGRNVVLEYRSAGGNAGRFAQAAQELVRLKVDVIYAVSAPAVHAARAATRTTPIVGMDYSTDPVAAGYADSYGHPGQNLTGVFLDAPAFTGKWLEILRAMVPGLSRIAVLWDPAPGDVHLRAVQSTAHSFGIQVQVLEVHAPDEIDAAFSTLRARPQALIVLPSPLLYSQSAKLAQLALKHRLAGTAMFRLFCDSGGLVTYGPDLGTSVERCAGLVAKILSGANPGDLPVERPAKFELIVNSKTVKALGLTVPDSVLVRADEVIR